MIEDRPSVTAAVVACARAAANPADAVTPKLVPGIYRGWLAATSPRCLGGPLSGLMRTATSGGLFDHMRLRTKAIDSLLQQAVKQGIDQVVLLGAGLDSRAYRLPWLSECTVYEVDHPASQAYKRRKAATLDTACQTLRHVTVDFEKESLIDRLRSAEFDTGRPAFWIWEGVTMYLPHTATEAALQAISSLSPPGSRLAATYMIPDHVGSTGQIRWVKRMLSVIDEPLIGALWPGQVQPILRQHGWQVLADGSNVDWARQMGESGAGWALLFRCERLVVAQKS